MAHRLRDRGYPFHQQTIQRVENEEDPRPLRLGEAIAVASILEISMFDLMSPEADFRLADVREDVYFQAAWISEQLVQARDKLLELSARLRNEPDETSESLRRLTAQLNNLIAATIGTEAVIGLAAFDEGAEIDYSRLSASPSDSGGDIGPVVWRGELEPIDSAERADRPSSHENAIRGQSIKKEVSSGQHREAP